MESAMEQISVSNSFHHEMARHKIDRKTMFSSTNFEHRKNKSEDLQCYIITDSTYNIDVSTNPAFNPEDVCFS